MRFSTVTSALLAAAVSVSALPYSPPFMHERDVPSHVALPRNFKMPTVHEVDMWKRAIELNLVTKIDAAINLFVALGTNSAQASFTAQNPVAAPLSINTLSFVGGINAKPQVTGSVDFGSGLPLPQGGSVTSPYFKVVLLGAVKSLPLLSSKTIDLQDANLTLSAFDFIPIKLVDIFQNGIPFSYTLKQQK